MCSVSMVSDFVRTIPLDNWTRPQYTEYQELIRRLDEIDRKLGLPDCADPKKVEFMKQIEERLTRLEEAARITTTTG